MAKRASGGRTSDNDWDGKNGRTDDDKAPTDVYAGKDSHVAKEAKGEMAGERKRGGAAGHDKDCTCKDCREKRKRGGKVEKVTGEAEKHRLDRKGRKRGGGVGSDSNPLTHASKTRDRRDGSGEAAITGGA